MGQFAELDAHNFGYEWKRAFDGSTLGLAADLVRVPRGRRPNVSKELELTINCCRTSLVFFPDVKLPPWRKE
jgi:hypothetical protein